jgi:hypothetical protein
MVASGIAPSHSPGSQVASLTRVGKKTSRAGVPVKPLFILFFATFLVVFAVQSLSAEVAVGNCRPHLVSYSTISEAVVAVSPNSTVLVCPGVYPEQVKISQPLTLRGFSDGTNSKAVITVPHGGIVSSFGQADQLSVQGGDFPTSGTVDISNIVVDGADSGFDCSTGILVGIAYQFANGTLDNIEVRRQSPSGCGFGVVLTGDPFVVNTVNVRNSSIRDFDNTGVLATSGGETGFLVNLTSNWIESSSTGVQAGIDYDLTDGRAVRNTIIGPSKFGLLLDNFFAGMTAHQNLIIGSNTGIYSSGGLPFSPTIITGNSVLNNGTGIFINKSSGNDVVKSNSIVHSTIAAIDVDCSGDTTVEGNIILGAPVGIANVTSGDTVGNNIIFSVPAATTTCPF